MNNEKLRADIKSALNGMPLAAMGTYAELLNRAYAALGEQQGAPAGHVMVPVEPPEAVLEILYDNGMDLDDQMLLNIWKWLLDAAPKAECTNSDSWNCKYCNKTKDCEALKDPRNFAAPKAEQPPVQEPVAWMLKNEKGRIEGILTYEPCAADMYSYWPAPIPLYAAPQPSDDARDALVVALDALIADYDGEIHNEYDGTSMLDSRLSEINYAREALAAYRASQEKPHD